jgi:aminoglycoside phosphotransferase (APT) family kinase protein
MRAHGPLLASGRDADIFEYGDRSVLRRARDGRSIAHEAHTMAYAHDQGFPTPAVEEISDDGSALVMERIEGPSMVAAINRAPWSVLRQADTLAELHLRLHDIAAPDFLGPAPVGTGGRLLHLDLHPLNVLIGPRGPVVIDWPNAARGDPVVDVGLAWVLMGAGEIPSHRLVARLLGPGRALLVNRFVSHFDRSEVVAGLRDVVAWKATDTNMSPSEVDGMWKVVKETGGGR